MLVQRFLTSCLVLAVCLAPAPAFAAPPADYKGRPFADELHKAGPRAIPGIVQCALYDLGGDAGLQVLTFHYGRGNNWAFWVFEKVGPVPAARR